MMSGGISEGCCLFGNSFGNEVLLDGIKSGVVECFRLNFRFNNLLYLLLDRGSLSQSSSNFTDCFYLQPQKAYN